MFSIDSTTELPGAARARPTVPWWTVLPLAVVMAYADGFWMVSLRGAERGLNAVFIFETAGLRIAHLGDLGHTLDDQQLSAIGAVDVVLVPVGGHFTIDALQATRVLDQLHPRLLIVPMHYRTAVSTVTQLAPVDEFLTGKANVRHLESNTLPITAIKSRPATEIVVMGWK